MNIVKSTSTCLGKFATFKGRASRSELWYFYLAYILFYLLLTVIAGEVGDVSLGLAILLLPTIVLGIPLVAVTVRRLHDIGKSGWWYWITMIPLVGVVWIIVLLATGAKTEGDKYNLTRF
jgi:uncharacterized membrane protein YhaH (DUF805 family)